MTSSQSSSFLIDNNYINNQHQLHLNNDNNKLPELIHPFNSSKYYCKKTFKIQNVLTDMLLFSYENCIVILISQCNGKIGNVLMANSDFDNQTPQPKLTTYNIQNNANLSEIQNAAVKQFPNNNDNNNQFLHSSEFNIQTLLGQRPSLNDLNQNDIITPPTFYQLLARQIISSICNSDVNHFGACRRLILGVSINKSLIQREQLKVVKMLMYCIEKMKFW